jgi:hypothetical protein
VNGRALVEDGRYDAEARAGRVLRSERPAAPAGCRLSRA